MRFKAGPSVVEQLEALVERQRAVVVSMEGDLLRLGGYIEGYCDALALVTAKDRDLGQ